MQQSMVPQHICSLAMIGNLDAMMHTKCMLDAAHAACSRLRYGQGRPFLVVANEKSEDSSVKQTRTSIDRRLIIILL